MGPLGFGCRLLRIMLQDGSLLDFLGSVAKRLSGKEMAVRAKELELSKVVESGCVWLGEECNLDSLLSLIDNFNTIMGMSVEGFEKEINSLLRKMEARRGCGVMVSSGKRKREKF